MAMAVEAQQAAQEIANEAHRQSALAIGAAARTEEALKDCKSK